MLPSVQLNDRKEAFSRAYVSALCSTAGCSIADWSVDDDSVDLTIKKRGASGAIPTPMLDMQLKATARAVVDESGFSFALKKKNYDDLRQQAHYPRILVVVTLPSDDCTEWLEQLDETRLSLMSCGYWEWPKNLPDSETDTSTTVPLTKPLTSDALNDLMERISHQRPLLDGDE
jgi:hypothetical protein